MCHERVCGVSLEGEWCVTRGCVMCCHLLVELVEAAAVS